MALQIFTVAYNMQQHVYMTSCYLDSFLEIAYELLVDDLGHLWILLAQWMKRVGKPVETEPMHTRRSVCLQQFLMSPFSVYSLYSGSKIKMQK